MSPLASLDAVAFTHATPAGVVPVLHGIDGTISSGDRIAVVGPSGSGKSTLLHLLGGFEQPTAGRIVWHGQPRPRPTPAFAGLMFQTASLIGDLSARENVELPLLLQGVIEADAADRAKETLDRLGLRDLEDSLPHELSGGQAQRVNLARALVSRPRLLLADEPTGQLDQATADEVLDVLLELIEEDAVALVVSTHDDRVAERLDQRWLLRSGLIEEEVVAR